MPCHELIEWQEYFGPKEVTPDTSKEEARKIDEGMIEAQQLLKAMVKHA
jgi:hypothetical protein